MLGGEGSDTSAREASRGQRERGLAERFNLHRHECIFPPQTGAWMWGRGGRRRTKTTRTLLKNVESQLALRRCTANVFPLKLTTFSPCNASVLPRGRTSSRGQMAYPLSHLPLVKGYL